MKLSERFKLSKTQFELDFVDIDTDFDTRLFVDPYLLGLRPDRWSIKAASSVRSFFSHFLDLVRQGKRTMLLNSSHIFMSLMRPASGFLQGNLGVTELVVRTQRNFSKASWEVRQYSPEKLPT